MSMNTMKRTTINGMKHPYQRAEKWISELAFWNTPNHVQEKYEDFHQRMINEAGKRGRT
jgi:hypothetical protein